MYRESIFPTGPCSGYFKYVSLRPSVQVPSLVQDPAGRDAGPDAAGTGTGDPQHVGHRLPGRVPQHLHTRGEPLPMPLVWLSASYGLGP